MRDTKDTRADDANVGVTSESVFQQVGELRVAIWYVRAAVYP